MPIYGIYVKTDKAKNWPWHFMVRAESGSAKAAIRKAKKYLKFHREYDCPTRNAMESS